MRQNTNISEIVFLRTNEIKLVHPPMSLFPPLKLIPSSSLKNPSSSRLPSFLPSLSVSLSSSLSLSPLLFRQPNDRGNFFRWILFRSLLRRRHAAAPGARLATRLPARARIYHVSSRPRNRNGPPPPPCLPGARAGLGPALADSSRSDRVLLFLRSLARKREEN